ncbi:MAG: hypothetical protein KTR31_35895 [Myxococcales bacterium]|nr:hypothetical protein [Myxococcales bacterium]
MDLAQLTAAARTGAWDRVLSLALVAWRARRCPELAELVHHASRMALERFDGPRGRTKAAFQAQWIALARQPPHPVHTGWLAATASQRLPDPPRRYPYVHPERARRQQHLLARCPDPRIADEALRVLQTTRSVRDYALDTFYGPLVERLHAGGDPELAPAVRDLIRTPPPNSTRARSWLRQHLPMVADHLDALPVTKLDPDTADALAALIPQPRSPARHSTALTRAVRAQPRDDDLKQVLGDAWIEEDDPRGEIVALERAGAGPEHAQIRSLVRRHARDWLGPHLFATLLRPTFRGGLLHGAELRSERQASTGTWEAALADERLRTLRVLSKGNGNRDLYVRTLLSPNTVDLRDVELPWGGTQQVAQALADGRYRPIHRVRIGRPARRPLLAILGEAATFAELHTLALPPQLHLEQLLEDLTRTGLHERLRALELQSTNRAHHHLGTDGAVLPRLEHVLRSLPRLQRLTLGDPRKLQLSAVRTGPCAARLELTLGAHHTDGTFFDGGRNSQLCPPDAVTAATLRGPGAAPDLAAAWSRRWDIPVSLEPPRS